MKLAKLEDAIATHVKPGMSLNFASTPSRSNAAVRELARQFRGKDPRFEIASTGFHSTLHLLPLLRLGRKYVACFFGDNYPVPRPNDLYSALLAEGAEIQMWSLWTYVSALRAGALGQPYAVVRSLVGSSMGADLEKAGVVRFVNEHAEVKAMRSDITFVHGLFSDPRGNVVFSPPYSEGFWGAIGARTGVIATVEKILTTAECAAFSDAMKIPAHRILAVCEAPFGTHPQPLYAEPRFGEIGYVDDFEHYEKWRALSTSREAFETFVREVLCAPDPDAAYRAFVGEDRLAASVTAARPRVPTVRPKSGPVGAPGSGKLRPPPRETPPAREIEILLVLAARAIAERVKIKGYPIILAGIGHAFFAARIARILLAADGIDVKVMVETGLYDLECGAEADEFLLSHRNIALAKRHSSVEDILGTITCGADSVCLGVIGAGQIDARGRINSTRIGGKLLVGSGGANDIASSAAELVVVTRTGRGRLVPETEYVTSPGHRVETVVTDLCTLRRNGDKWAVEDVYPAFGGKNIEEALATIRAECPWPLSVREDIEYAPLISTAEMVTVHRLDPNGVHFRRER
jgi:acyl CoA:acetate/3-ketoacid CoA transferase beta subunit/acyl CoA:acetate/3-ketoacid CoA transferase alpha subunit